MLHSTQEIFFFKDGNVIFWNVPELERNSVLNFVNDYAMESYEEDLIYEESEMMSYTKTRNLKTLKKNILKHK